MPAEVITCVPRSSVYPFWKFVPDLPVESGFNAFSTASAPPSIRKDAAGRRHPRGGQAWSTNSPSDCEGIEHVTLLTATEASFFPNSGVVILDD